MRSFFPLVMAIFALALCGPGGIGRARADDAPGAAKPPPPANPAINTPPAAKPAPSTVQPIPIPPPSAQAASGAKPAAPPIGAKLAAPPIGGIAPAEAVKRTSEPQAVAIVDAYLKAIGGKELLAKIKDRVTKFRNIKHAATGETVAIINLLIKEGLLIREEWEIEGFDIKGEKLAFIQIYNGNVEEGWVHMLGTVSPLDGRTLQVFVWDKQMDDFFCHWEEDGFTLSMAGQGIVPKEIIGEETPCDIVLVTDFSGRQQQRFFFSKKDALILKKEWQDAGANPKATVKKEQYYKMYRDLAFMDGSGLSVKFPLKLEIFLDGDLDTERIYSNVRFNSGLSDKLFDKPEGKPFVGAPPPPPTPKKVEEDLPPWKREKAKAGGGPKVKTSSEPTAPVAAPPGTASLGNVPPVAVPPVAPPPVAPPPAEKKPEGAKP